MNAEHTDTHASPAYSLYVRIWAVLVLLTCVTVAVSYVDMKQVRVMTALMIASGKAMLVLLYFMHLRYERPVFLVMALVVLVTYAIFIGLTFSDYYYR